VSTQACATAELPSEPSASVCADVVFVCYNLGAGGIQRVVSVLSNEWSRRGRNICVVTSGDQSFFTLDHAVRHIVFRGDAVSRLGRLPARAVSWRNVFLTELRKWRLANWRPVRMFGHALHLLLLRLPFNIYLAAMFFLDVRALRSILVRLDAPLVVSMGTEINVLTLVAAKGLGLRVVISERGDARAMHMHWLWGGLTARLYGRAHLVTANSRAMVSYMRGFVAADNLSFVPNPLWVERGHGIDRDYDNPTAPFVLSVARLVPEKAPDVLLEAFALVAKEFRECRLALVGEGVLETTLRAQAARLGIAEQIDWCGLVKDPLPHYNIARLFVLPSRIEGTPNALLEAMGCGVPVIVSDGTPGLLEVVEHGVTGLVVPVDDAVALAAALRLMLSDASLRRRLGLAARERVREYELSRSLASWEAALGLANQHPSPRG
jgi:GalNAc-alpha-(1->4)-GalNAc-alpha-(1->3)-diNAcBac-PP-undecaprenol alpha-1,4-N-acetyl-D-galactosaminyltransferase